MTPRANVSTYAMLAALVIIVIAVVALSLIGRSDNTANTVLILGGSVTTLAGALAGFSQHPSIPAPLPPGGMRETATLETAPIPKETTQ